MCYNCLLKNKNTMVSVGKMMGGAVNGIFNITVNEWPKVILSWIIRFCYRFGFVIGWTVMVAVFVTKFGISSLPYLFVINGVFTILGSVIYATFIDRFSRRSLMISSLFLTSIFLFLALVFVKSYFSLCFGLLIVAEAVFLMQFRILANGYIEDMFNATESERTFPVIESADTIGGILAGLLVIFLVEQIQIYSFVYIWIAALLLIVPVLLFVQSSREEISLVSESAKSSHSFGIITKIKREFANSSNISYIKGLFLIVFFFWMSFSLLEFQYTKAIYQNVSNMVLDAGSGFEHAFVHDLGKLSILFSASSLLIQFFLGSRLISKFGVFGSMLIHPIVSILSFLSLLFSFNFLNAVMVKNNFAITSVLYNNGYHCGYYAIKERLREHSRELMEGIVRPIGAIAGTFLVILMQFLLRGSALTVSINLIMIVISVVIFYVIYRQQKNYTKLVVSDLFNSKDRKIRLNAIDILAQKGHGSSLHVLSKIVFDVKQPLIIRLRAIRGLGDLGDLPAFEVVLKCLDNKSLIVRDAALTTMFNFNFLASSSKIYLMPKYRLIVALKRIYSTQENAEVNTKIIKLMAQLSNVAALEFLLAILSKPGKTDKNSAILALAGYEGVEIEKILYPYLRSKSIDESLSAALVLYKSVRFGDEALHVLGKFLLSKHKKTLVYGIFAIGELNLKKYIGLCEKHLNSKNQNLSLASAIALAKMASTSSVSVLVKFLFSSDEGLAAEAKREIKHIDVRILKIVDKIVRDRVQEEIEHIVSLNKKNAVNKFEREHLLHLKRLYSLIEEYDEIEEINKLLI